MEVSANYPVGSKVVHPNYGAGTIVGIQEKSIGETSHKYYVIETGAMQLMVPVKRAARVGLRRISRPSRLRHALASCCEPPAEDEIIRDWRARHAIISEQLKSGSFEQVVSVMRVLFFLNSRRPLGWTDRRSFNRGKDILAGELALASGQEIEEAEKEIEERLAEMLETEEE